MGLSGIRPGACKRKDPPSPLLDGMDELSLAMESDPPGAVDTGGAGATMFVTSGELNGQRATRARRTDAQLGAQPFQ